MMPRDSTTGDRVTYAPPSSTTSMSWARSRPSVVSAVRWRTRDGWRFVVDAMSSGRSYTILTGRPALSASNAACSAIVDGYSSLPPKPPPVGVWITRTRRGAKIQRRRLGRDHHVDRAGRAPCHFPRGMRHQQHRLVHVAHVSGGEHRLVALDEEDFVRGGNVPVIDDDDLRPVHLGSEADECDATARGGTPDRHPPQRALER